MTKPVRFLAICLLVVSIFGSALADGGETQGGNSPAPPVPPPCCNLESVEAAALVSAPAYQQDSLVDLATMVRLSITMLGEVIF